ncbi:MAG TPA: hypothetical protein PKD91_00050 [Bacteroidia bacterium]|nr:hypothetical protein [Bacteroidia bacterium]
MKNKLLAFTVLELLIAMILSAIVFITAFTMYIYTFKEIDAVKKINMGMMDRSTFFNVFRNDMLFSQIITGNSLHLEMKYNESRIVSYNSTERFITRCENNLCDTFLMEIKDFKINYLKNESDTNRLIKSISMKIGNNDNFLPLFVAKNYASFDLITSYGPYFEKP